MRDGRRPRHVDIEVARSAPHCTVKHHIACHTYYTHRIILDEHRSTDCLIDATHEIRERLADDRDGRCRRVVGLEDVPAGEQRYLQCCQETRVDTARLEKEPVLTKLFVDILKLYPYVLAEACGTVGEEKPTD